jgi:hypothetical protein
LDNIIESNLFIKPKYMAEFTEDQVQKIVKLGDFKGDTSKE